MAVSGNLHKLVWGGSLSVTEQWSCSLHFSTIGTVLRDPSLASTALTAWMTRATTLVGSHTKFEWIKLNQVDPLTGRYTDPAQANTWFKPVALGGLGGYGYPQLTLAVSTMTAVVRGRGHAGRFYPPVGASVPASDNGVVALATVQGMASSALQLIQDLNNDLGGKCVVFSKLGQVDNDITHVRVGRIIDTQQRRRRSLIEDYQSSAQVV